MSDEKVITKKTEVTITENESKELRNNFTKLLLENPNYFGNHKNSKQKAKIMMAQNTSYEQIAEIGYNPYQDVLYSVINIKNTYGYSGTLCTSGSNEYVRFYADLSGNGTFTDLHEDVGVASVNVHDIPGPKPFSYCVSVKLNPEKKVCLNPYKVKVRAILSWNSVPPANTPDYHPVWGEIQETWIQIKPLPIKLNDFIDYSKIKIEKDLAKNIDLEQIIEKPAVLSNEALKELYKDLKVEEHRVEVNEVANHIEMLSKNASLAVGDFETANALLSDSMKKAILAAMASQSNTSYEELRSVGLQYDTDTLTAIIRIKKPGGYSGGLCTNGSNEYVAFYADWDNNGTFEDYLGTTSLNVHDIAPIPESGLDYAVSLPVNMATRKKMCSNPTVFHIRAILSWNVLPPVNPNYAPYWGNHKEAIIQVKPGVHVGSGEHLPYISMVGNMAVTDINSNGFATGTAVVSGFQAQNSPFGGWVTISGHISNPPNLSAGEANLKYYASYRKVGDLNWTKITNNFQITISQWDGTTWNQYHQNQIADANGCYLYREDLTVNPPGDKTQLFVEGFVMSSWYTGGLEDGLYEIKLTNAAGLIDSNIVRVRLDNKAPDVGISITDVINGGVSGPAKPCGVFIKGCKIMGKFKANDNNFLKYHFVVEPAILSPNSVDPVKGEYPAVSGVADSAWELETSNMQSCGYVVYLHVYDRTIVNSGYIGWYNKATVGFCLTE